MSDSAAMVRMALAGTAVFGLGLLGGYMIANRDKSERKTQESAASAETEKGKNPAVNAAAGEVIRAPFPAALVQLLKSTSLCYLSTTGKNADEHSAGDPHLSLMLFTFESDPKEGDIIVMTTRRDTQKLQNILLNPKVAILVHDFPAAKGELEDVPSPESPKSPKSPTLANGKYSRTSSITVYGEIRILEEGSADEDRYRKNHLQANPKYGQFIEGPGIAVLLVVVESARICNVDDKVTMWSVRGDDSPTK